MNRCIIYSITLWNYNSILKLRKGVVKAKNLCMEISVVKGKSVIKS